MTPDQVKDFTRQAGGLHYQAHGTGCSYFNDAQLAEFVRLVREGSRREAPCANQCEAQAFKVEERMLKAELSAVSKELAHDQRDTFTGWPDAQGRATDGACKECYNVHTDHPMLHF